MAGKTLNEYLTAISALLNWMSKAGRISDHPLRGVQKVETRGRQKKERRAYTIEQLQRLVTGSGKRGIVYLVAAYTGLRRGELGKVERRDLHLDAPEPFIKVRGATTKNHKDATLPLHPDVVAALRELITSDMDPMQRVFKGLLPRMPRFKKDLAAAGIDYVDAKGEFADFHALRHTFATHLAAQGTPLIHAKELMRHSSPQITAKIYTHAEHLPLAMAVLSLPSVLNSNTQIHSHVPGSEGPAVSLPVPHGKMDETLGSPNSQSSGLIQAQSVPSCLNGQLVRDAGFEPAAPAV